MAQISQYTSPTGFKTTFVHHPLLDDPILKGRGLRQQIKDKYRFIYTGWNWWKSGQLENRVKWPEA